MFAIFPWRERPPQKSPATNLCLLNRWYTVGNNHRPSQKSGKCRTNITDLSPTTSSCLRNTNMQFHILHFQREKKRQDCLLHKWRRRGLAYLENMSKYLLIRIRILLSPVTDHSKDGYSLKRRDRVVFHYNNKHIKAHIRVTALLRWRSNPSHGTSKYAKIMQPFIGVPEFVLHVTIYS